ncbi:hypothetical protein M2169_000721 [Streptomyces sp. MJP52]|nr:hypothetical protein [Streptomyces sp. MJP52]
MEGSPRLHEEYGAADEDRALGGEGLVALGPLTTARLAHDADMPLDVTSEYRSDVPVKAGFDTWSVSHRQAHAADPDPDPDPDPGPGPGHRNESWTGSSAGEGDGGGAAGRTRRRAAPSSGPMPYSRASSCTWRVTCRWYQVGA